MNKTICLLSLLSTAALQAQENYRFYLDQQNIIGDGFVRTVVERESSATSALAIPEGGSEFTLWAVEEPDGPAPVWTRIESQTVGAVLPRGEVTITSLDPFSDGIPRTRIDQPFTIEITVGGLEPNNPEAPEGIQRVLLDNRVSSSFETADTNPETTSTIVSQGFIEENGTEVTTRLGNLPGEDPFSESGIETITLHALPDGQTAGAILDQAQGLILPLASSSFDGISEDQVYASIPQIDVELTNVYPDSETFIRVFPTLPTPIPGEPELDPCLQGTKITQSTLIVNDVVPRDGTLTFPNLGNQINAPGDWTIAVVTVTPFGCDLIGSISFTFEPLISVRGNIQTLN